MKMFRAFVVLKIAAIVMVGTFAAAQLNTINYFNSDLQQVYPITAGPDGALWYWGFNGGGGSSVIGQMTMLGQINLYPITYSGSYVNAMTAGSDGEV